MISNYKKPQSTIDQTFLVGETPPVGRNHAVVIGPVYDHADKATGNLDWKNYYRQGSLSYSKSVGGQSIEKPENQKIDYDHIGIEAKDVHALLFDKGEPTSTSNAESNQFHLYKQDTASNVLQYQDNILDLDNPSVAEKFDKGRIPQPGDIYEIKSSFLDQNIFRRVASLAGKDIEAEAIKGPLRGAHDWTYEGDDKFHYETISKGHAFELSYSEKDNAEVFKYLNNKNLIFPVEGGVRAIIELECIQGGRGSDTYFRAKVNGESDSSIIHATAGSTAEADDVTEVQLFGNNASLEIGSTRFLEYGDKFSFQLDLKVDNTLFGSNLFVRDYTFESGIHKINSTISAKVVGINHGNGVVTVRVHDSNGLMRPQTLEFDSLTSTYSSIPYDGGDLYVSLPGLSPSKAYVGLTIIYTIKPPRRSTRVFDKVVLQSPTGIDGANPNIRVGVNVKAYTKFTGPIEKFTGLAGVSNYVIGDEEISEMELKVNVAGYTNSFDALKPLVSGKGYVAPVWRAIVPPDPTEGLIPIDYIEDIEERIGSSDLVGELGFGIHAARLAAGKRVYALRTSGNSLEDFEKAIKVLESTDSIYTIAPLSDDLEVLRAFADHTEKMNAPETKRFRRVYGSTDSPGEFTVAEEFNGDLLEASISVGNHGKNTLVTFSNPGFNLYELNIGKGDKLYLVNADTNYIIESIGSEDTLVLKNGPAAPINPQTWVKLVAANNPKNVSYYVKQRSADMGTNLSQERRISNIWTHNGIAIDETLSDGLVHRTRIPNRFLAADTAGRRTRLEPQESMTRKPLSVITDAPSMYTEFTQGVLDDMAAHGVWIVTQDGPDGIPYHRHQITTAVNDGPMFYEDSVGVISDFVSFAVDEINDPLIGNRNVTNSTRVELKNKVVSRLNEMTEASPSSTIGPMIDSFYDRDGKEGTVNVEFDPNFGDRFNLYYEIDIPFGLNTIRVSFLSRSANQRGLTTTTLERRVLNV